MRILQENELEDKLIISYSALAAFKTCPKSYQIEYEWGRESKHNNEYIKKGSLFHKYIETAILNDYVYDILTEDHNAEMWHIVNDYEVNIGFPINVLSCEKSYYCEILPNVVFRVTPDLVYLNKYNDIICRDWKTFSKRPNIELHISDQARFYIIILELFFEHQEVNFEFEYVRSERIKIPRGKQKPWTQADSYFTIPYSLNSQQKQRTKLDLLEAIQALLYARERQSFYRTGRSGYGQGSCTGCLQRPLCSEEWEHGYVSQERLEALSNIRPSLIDNGEF